MLGLCCFAQAVSSCNKQGLVFVAVLGLLGGTVSQCGGFSCCRGQAPGARASVGAARTQLLWHTGSVALRHVGSSQTRDRTHVPCLGKWILSTAPPRKSNREATFHISTSTRTFRFRVCPEVGDTYIKIPVLSM